MPFDKSSLLQRTAPFGVKFAWFLSKGYVPHNWQLIFHTMRNEDVDPPRLCRFRHLVAGRRGGKTLSAAWELLFYLLHPRQFHIDAHGEDRDRKLVAWVLTKDYPAGLPALMTFREVLAQAGMTHGIEYKENRGNRWFEFENGSFLAFKTADEPDSLRGAGLDVLWMDEAAFIPNSAAWDVVRPALSDKLGIVLTTTTPSGKNWFYDEFWAEEVRTNSNNGSVEYWSIDNPYFPEEEWMEVKRRYHPLLFKQEYCAAFDSMAGKELAGDWLHYYTEPELPKRKDMRYFVGVDPAISLADTADRFAMACVGVMNDNSQVFLVDLFAGRIPFPEQLEKIQEWHIKYRPDYIGIESNAFQRALEQQAARLPTFPNTIPMFAKGKKFERILTMAPLFRTGKVKLRSTQRDFIDEWLDYDSQIKNPKDDCLDAVEIALRTAGVLLQEIPEPKTPSWQDETQPVASLDELALRDRFMRKRKGPVDEHLGDNW